MTNNDTAAALVAILRTDPAARAAPRALADWYDADGNGAGAWFMRRMLQAGPLPHPTTRELESLARDYLGRLDLTEPPAGLRVCQLVRWDDDFLAWTIEQSLGGDDGRRLGYEADGPFLWCERHAQHLRPSAHPIA